MTLYHYHGKANICGEAIRQARQSKKMTQDELAAQLIKEDVFINQKAVSRMETGERFIADYEVRALARVLDMDVKQLMGIEN